MFQLNVKKIIASLKQMIYLSGFMTVTFYDVIILFQGHDLKLLTFFYHVLYSFLKLDVQNSLLTLHAGDFFQNLFKKINKLKTLPEKKKG